MAQSDFKIPASESRRLQDLLFSLSWYSQILNLQKISRFLPNAIHSPIFPLEVVCLICCHQCLMGYDMTRNASTEKSCDFGTRRL
jgi:hypothetical protein